MRSKATEKAKSHQDFMVLRTYGKKGGSLPMSSLLLFLQMFCSFLPPSFCLVPLQTPDWQAILGGYTPHPSFVLVVVSGTNK